MGFIIYTTYFGILTCESARTYRKENKDVSAIKGKKPTHHLISLPLPLMWLMKEDAQKNRAKLAEYRLWGW